MFEDKIVSSTELNRRSGEVLRLATEQPVTIVRTEGDLVILRRDRAARLSQAADVVASLLRAFISALPLDDRSDTAWVLTLDLDDQLDMAAELLDALQSGNTHLPDIASIIHEWRESALDSANPVLMNALKTSEEEFLARGGIPLE